MGFNATGDADITNMGAMYTELSAADATQEQNLDILWLLFGAYLVFFMQVRSPSSLPTNFLSLPPFGFFFLFVFLRLDYDGVFNEKLICVPV